MVALAAAGMLVPLPAAMADRPRVPTIAAMSGPAVPTLACGVTFKPDALRRTRGYELRTNPLARALAASLRSASDEDIPRAGWFLVGRDRDYAEVLAGSLPAYDRLGFRLRRGRWERVRSGVCEPAPYRQGGDAAGWSFDRRPDPRDRVLSVEVVLDECHGSVNPPLMRPRVHYGRRAITLTFHTRKLPPGNYTCPAVPGTRVNVRLAQRIGARGFRDGGTYPARRERPPPG